MVNLEKNTNILEALFFIKGEEGIAIDYYSEFMDLSMEEAEIRLNKFQEEYNSKSKSLIIKKFGATYKMLVIDTVYAEIKEKLSSKKLTKLSKAAMETLAIIAYNQPISKVEIEEIRGVNSDNIISNLMEKELIYSDKVLDKIGKPKLYETTDYFLDIFGLESLDKLPEVKVDEKAEEDKINEFLND